MRFTFENEALKNLKDALQVVVAGVKEDVKANLLLGAQDLGEMVLCGVRVTTQTEQIQYQFAAKKPEGFVVSKENMVDIYVSAAKFVAIVDMTLSFNSDVFIDVEENRIVIGVEGRCKSPLAMEAITIAPIGQTGLLYRFKISGTNLSTLLKKGCAFADDSPANRVNMSSIVLMKPASIIVGYSTDGHIVSRSIVSVEFEKGSEDARMQQMIEQMEKNVEAVCVENGKDKDKYIVSIPKPVVAHMEMLASGQKMVVINIDDSHLHMQIGNSIIYTVTMAASDTPVAMIDGLLGSPVSSQIGVDLATLTKGVDFINKIEGVSGNADKYPIKVEAVAGDEGKLVLTDDSGVDLETVVKPTKVVNSSKFAVGGKYLRAALNALTKGGVVITVGEKFISLYNGTVENIDQNSVIAMLQVDLAKNSAANNGNAEASEADEASAE